MNKFNKILILTMATCLTVSAIRSNNITIKGHNIPVDLTKQLNLNNAEDKKPFVEFAVKVADVTGDGSKPLLETLNGLLGHNNKGIALVKLSRHGLAEVTSANELITNLCTELTAKNLLDPQSSATLMSMMGDITKLPVLIDWLK